MIQVPDDLAELDRWAVWRNEAGRKIPYRVDGRGASTTKSEDWGQLDDALKALATGRYTGLAFVFIQSDGLVGVDLDDALDSTGKPKAAIQGMLEKFHDTYAETSPSGCGVKLWTRGKLVGSVKAALADGVGLEIYATARLCLSKTPCRVKWLRTRACESVNSQAFCSQRIETGFNAAISGDWWSQERGNARSGAHFPRERSQPRRFQAARRS
jgi:primase-polymerase (primpol)-like protein